MGTVVSAAQGAHRMKTKGPSTLFARQDFKSIDEGMWRVIPSSPPVFRAQAGPGSFARRLSYKEGLDREGAAPTSRFALMRPSIFGLFSAVQPVCSFTKPPIP